MDTLETRVPGEGRPPFSTGSQAGLSLNEFEERTHLFLSSRSLSRDEQRASTQHTQSLNRQRQRVKLIALIIIMASWNRTRQSP